MQTSRIAALLEPFLAAPLAEAQLKDISTYIDILLGWNARINLTAVRQPEEIVTRHFGESLFAARHLFPEVRGRTSVPAGPNVRVGTGVLARSAEPSSATDDTAPHLVDLGSGAGFPGLPIKLWAPQCRLTLIESNHKKVAFLREVARTLTLTDVDVFAGRGENFPAAQADVVTLRAVERFDSALPVAARLVAPAGRLALLIGLSQATRVPSLLPDFCWNPPIPIPHSSSRVLHMASRLLHLREPK